MHTQHVKFSMYGAWGGRVGVAVAAGVVFEEGEFSGLEEDDGSVFKVVVVVVFFLPSLPFFWLILLDLLDFMAQI
tara:strand:+ start:322 stop:546 length:225 start_codon:yes stop_codon:yes gene_type:complete